MTEPAGPCPLIENIRSTRLELLLRISPSGVALYERDGEVVTADVADAVAELMNLGRCGLDALIRRELSSPDARVPGRLLIVFVVVQVALC